MPAAAKKTKSPEPIYVSKDGIILAWFYLTVGVLLFTAWYVKGISAAIHPGYKYVIMSRPDQRRSPDVMTKEIMLGHMEEEVRTMVDSVFNRNPTQLDLLDTARQFFTPEAWAAVSAGIEEESAVFSENRIHQKAEIGGLSVEEIPLENPAANKSLAPGFLPGPPNQRVTTTGQFIRIGAITKKGTNITKLFHEVWDFQLLLEFEPNGRLNANGVYPWICRDLQVKRRLSSSDRTLQKENT